MRHRAELEKNLEEEANKIEKQKKAVEEAAKMSGELQSDDDELMKMRVTTMKALLAYGENRDPFENVPQSEFEDFVKKNQQIFETLEEAVHELRTTMEKEKRKALLQTALEQFWHTKLEPKN